MTTQEIVLDTPAIEATELRHPAAFLYAKRIGSFTLGVIHSLEERRLASALARAELASYSDEEVRAFRGMVTDSGRHSEAELQTAHRIESLIEGTSLHSSSISIIRREGEHLAKWMASPESGMPEAITLGQGFYWRDRNGGKYLCAVENGSTTDTAIYFNYPRLIEKEGSRTATVNDYINLIQDVVTARNSLPDSLLARGSVSDTDFSPPGRFI